MKTSAAIISKLRADISVLEEKLEELKAADVFSLQNELRILKNDNKYLKKRNLELKQQLKLLEEKLWNDLRLQDGLSKELEKNFPTNNQLGEVGSSIGSEVPDVLENKTLLDIYNKDTSLEISPSSQMTHDSEQNMDPSSLSRKKVRFDLSTSDLFSRTNEMFKNVLLSKLANQQSDFNSPIDSKEDIVGGHDDEVLELEDKEAYLIRSSSTLLAENLFYQKAHQQLKSISSSYVSISPAAAHSGTGSEGIEHEQLQDVLAVPSDVRANDALDSDHSVFPSDNADISPQQQSSTDFVAFLKSIPSLSTSQRLSLERAHRISMRKARAVDQSTISGLISELRESSASSGTVTPQPESLREPVPPTAQSRATTNASVSHQDGEHLRQKGIETVTPSPSKPAPSLYAARFSAFLSATLRGSIAFLQRVLVLLLFVFVLLCACVSLSFLWLSFTSRLQVESDSTYEQLSDL